MKILKGTIQKSEILKTAETVFNGEMVKAVVDVGREAMGVDAGLHADIERGIKVVMWKIPKCE